jgi:poly(A) polymerase
MPSPSADPVAAREFAAGVVRRLREAGHEAYWAGGCVRDELLGRIPADYDVATAALPEVVRGVFGRRQTLAIGAAFGVITVLGPRDAGQVEVATFRTDADSTDGRHPAGVTFCSAREDASRRDFTINGMFLDPLSGEVHDFVGGREDLAAGVVRAIGTPTRRFAEDHLRMLRAVRFAAGFDFALDRDTRAGIERMTHLVTSVSPERIAAELRAMTTRPGRGRALLLLEETGLAREVLPEVAPAIGDATGRLAWHKTAEILAALDEPALPQAIALLCANTGADRPAAIAQRLRLSNHEAKAIAWLHAGLTELAGCGARLPSQDAATGTTENPHSLRVLPPGKKAGEGVSHGQLEEANRLESLPWSRIQPWVAHAHAPLLADLLRGRAARGEGDAGQAAWFTAQSLRPRVEIDPPPLVTGADLIAVGVTPGPAMGAALARIRAAQLDGQITSREQALASAAGDS